MKRLLFLAVLLMPTMAIAGEPYVVEFVQVGCVPCARNRPAVSGLIAAGYDVRVADVAKYPDLTERLGPKITPTFVAVDDQLKELGRLEGAKSANELRAFFQRHGIVAKPKQ